MAVKIEMSDVELNGKENIKPANRPSDLKGFSEFKGQRLVDFLLATVTIIILSPLILLCAMLSILLTGRLLKQQDSADSSTPAPQTPAASFNGKLPGAGFAGLFNVMAGSRTLVASSIESGRPGLFSSDRLRQGLGVKYLEEDIQAQKGAQWGLSSYLQTLAKSMLAAFASPVRDIKGGKDFHLFGVRIINTDMSSLLDECEETLLTKNQTTIGFVNADCMNKCFTDEQYHQTLRDTDRVYPDGIGVRLAAQMFGNGVEDNINGTDLFPLL